MVYNKTKRGLEKASGIVGVVGGALSIVGSFVIFILSCIIMAGASLAVGVMDAVVEGIGSETGAAVEGVADINHAAGASVGAIGGLLIVVALILLALSICSIVFGAKLIKSPVTPNGVVNRKGIEITHIVFSFLMGNWIAAGLEIGAVCLKDFVAETPNSKNNLYIKPVESAPQTAAKPAQEQSPFVQTNSSNVEARIAELKRLKGLGVLDEEAYNSAVEKILNDLK